MKIDKITQTANKIKEIINNDNIYSMRDYGLRTIPINQKVKIGDILDSSYVWIDGNQTDEKLKGASALDLVSCVNQAKYDIESKLKQTNEYCGNIIALLKGDVVGNGEDANEIIIENAEVVAIFKKKDLF
jgi:hypothetical protein